MAHGMRVGYPGGFFGDSPGGPAMNRAYPEGYLGGTLRGRKTDFGDSGSGDAAGAGAGGGGNGPGGDSAGPGGGNAAGPGGAGTGGASGTGGGSSSGSGADGNATGPGAAGPGVGTDGTGASSSAGGGIGAAGSAPGTGASIGGDGDSSGVGIGVGTAGGDPAEVNNPIGTTGPDPGNPDAITAPSSPAAIGPTSTGEPTSNPFDNNRTFSDKLSDFARALFSPTTLLSLANPTPLGIFGLGVKGLTGAAIGDINATAAANAARSGFGVTPGGLAAASAQLGAASAANNAAVGGSPAGGGSGGFDVGNRSAMPGVNAPTVPRQAAASPVVQQALRSPVTGANDYIKRRFGGLSVGT